jgi:hypothetical protein
MELASAWEREHAGKSVLLASSTPAEELMVEKFRISRGNSLIIC